MLDAVLMLKSTLFNWLADTILISIMRSFPLCAIARSTCALRLGGFTAAGILDGVWIPNVYNDFTLNLRRHDRRSFFLHIVNN